MIIGVGIDVCGVDRFAESIERRPGLVRRIFTSAEAERPMASKAARFAAKEALAKALGAPDGQTLVQDHWYGRSPRCRTRHLNHPPQHVPRCRHRVGRRNLRSVIMRAYCVDKIRQIEERAIAVEGVDALMQRAAAAVAASNPLSGRPAPGRTGRIAERRWPSDRP